MLCLFGGSGCKSYSPTRYVSPRVEGRVVDAQTHQPIRSVEVRRLTADESYRRLEPPKGGEMLKRAASVRTAEDGTFALNSVRDLVLFRKLGWYSVSISFDHSSYLGMTATYTIADATNSASGEPVVRTGDIPLVARGR